MLKRAIEITFHVDIDQVGDGTDQINDHLNNLLEWYGLESSACQIDWRDPTTLEIHIEKGDEGELAEFLKLVLGHPIICTIIKDVSKY